MRADRLVAILLLLQARGRVTAAQVAAELEISHRTARRDLDALAVAGVPLYSTPGRGGGWKLIGGARTDLTGFNAAEAQALLLAATAGGVATGATGTALATALPKLVQAIPETFRPEVEAAARRVLFDPARWTGQPPVVDEEVLATLRGAVVEGQQVDLGYRRPDQSEPTVRRVHPLGLVSKAAVWYLVGMTAAGRRTYRVSRVASVVVTDSPVERPVDFDLDEAWEAIKADFGSAMGASRVTGDAEVEPWTLTPLRMQPGLSVDVLEPVAGGRLRVRLLSPSWPQLAHGLAGFGSAVEVLGPDELQARLGEVGRFLAERYD